MENKTWIGISAVLLLTLLGSIGYSISENTFYCSDRGIIMECMRFSESGNRCYPNLLDNKGYRDCNEWIKVEKELNLLTNETTLNNAKQYLCDQKECIPI